jgi:hypothetical protein
MSELAVWHAAQISRLCLHNRDSGSPVRVALIRIINRALTGGTNQNLWDFIHESGVKYVEQHGSRRASARAVIVNYGRKGNPRSRRETFQRRGREGTFCVGVC